MRKDDTDAHPQMDAPLARSRFMAAFQASDNRQAVAAIAQPVRSLSAITDLMREGDTTDRLYILTEGWACRYKTTRDGRRQIIALVLPGEVANLDTLLFGRADFGVRALTAAKAVPMSCDAALTLAAQHAGIGRTFTRLALVENAILSQWALCLGRMSAQQRLAHLLCELAERLAPGQTGDGVHFDLPLTQEQVADALGLTAVHVNRTLQQLRTEGLVETANRTVRLRDMSRLTDIAGFNAAYLHNGSAGERDRTPVPA